jgi:UDP-GlcNAc:undecaprenyl-phosphate GlcNAc-1-phosphate transferase
MLVIAPAVFWFGDFSLLLEKRFLIVLIIGIAITAISFVDDMETIGKTHIKVPPLFRLMMQIGVGAVIGLTSIKISYVSHVFGGILRLDDIFFSFQVFDWNIVVYVFPLLVTIFWYVLVFNSVNFSDGVPGLTGGFALISFLILAGLATKLYLTDDTIAGQENSRFLLTLLAIIIPATFFLTKNDISRKVIMGDSGTIMLAFLIATLAIIGGGKIATATAVLGIYIIDFIYVITSRLMAGKNPLKGEQSTHLHFRLMELGLSAREIRSIVYFLTLTFGLAAIFLGTTGKIFLIFIISAITVFITDILE